MKFSGAYLSSRLPLDGDQLLVKLLTAHKGFPLPYPLSGGFFEELFAQSVGGVREPRKLLFDVTKGTIGWSLKTLLGLKKPGSSFECVVQRCDILKDRKLSLISPVEELGKAVLLHFNTSCELSSERQEIEDQRAAFLLRDRAERNFIFFQVRYRLYSNDEVAWRWSNDESNSLLGYVEDKLVLRWYRSGTQLFRVYQIPEDAHIFVIDGNRASLDQTLEFLKRSGAAHTVPNV